MHISRWNANADTDVDVNVDVDEDVDADEDADSSADIRTDDQSPRPKTFSNISTYICSLSCPQFWLAVSMIHAHSIVGRGKIPGRRN